MSRCCPPVKHQQPWVDEALSGLLSSRGSGDWRLRGEPRGSPSRFTVGRSPGPVRSHGRAFCFSRRSMEVSDARSYRGLRQDGNRGLRQRAPRARLGARLDGRHAPRDRGGGDPGHGHRAGHRLPGDARRAREDPPPGGARGHPRPPRPGRARRGAGPARLRRHRPGGLQPLPLPGGGHAGGGRLLRRGHREHRHRRADDAAGSGQESRRRRRPLRSGRLRAHARSAGRRRARRRGAAADSPGRRSSTSPATTAPWPSGSGRATRRRPR